MHSYTDCPELDEDEESAWMNQCQFECKECSSPSQFSTRNKLILHLFKEHKMPIKEYIKKESNIISLLVNHDCKICGKTMRWDSDTITAHLDKFHSTVPAKYFQEHLKDNLDDALSSSKVSRCRICKTYFSSSLMMWQYKIELAPDSHFIMV
jgi:hypothetical protein